MNLFEIIITYSICFFSIAGYFIIFPYISRKNTSFGISIPENQYHSPEIKAIRKKYTFSCSLVGLVLPVVAIILAIVLKNQDLAILIILPGIFILLFSFMAIYLAAHKGMKKLKMNSTWKNEAKQVVVIDTNFRKGKLMASPLWFISYLIAIIATLGMGIYFYDQAPDKIPMNIGFNGEVYEYVDKSMRVFWIPVLAQLTLLIIFIFAYWVIGKAKQQIDASNPELSKEQNRIFRLKWSCFIICTGLALMFLFMLMQLTSLGFIKNLQVLFIFVMLIPLFILVASIVLSIKTGQSGSRIHVYTKKNGEKVSISRDDDRYWKMGIFYYNPEDHSLFIEKRFGLGWTMNFGRPLAWGIFIGLLLFIMGFSVFITYFSK